MKYTSLAAIAITILVVGLRSTEAGANEETLLISAKEEIFPEKNQLISYEVPINWISRINTKHPFSSLASRERDIVCMFNALEETATLENLERQAAMIQEVLEGIEEEDRIVPGKAKEDIVGELTRYTVSYKGKVEDMPVHYRLITIKTGKDGCVIVHVIFNNPEKISKENMEALDKMLQSIKVVKIK